MDKKKNIYVTLGVILIVVGLIAVIYAQKEINTNDLYTWTQPYTSYETRIIDIRSIGIGVIILGTLSIVNIILMIKLKVGKSITSYKDLMLAIDIKSIFNHILKFCFLYFLVMSVGFLFLGGLYFLSSVSHIQAGYSSFEVAFTELLKYKPDNFSLIQSDNYFVTGYVAKLLCISSFFSLFISFFSKFLEYYIFTKNVIDE